MQWITLFAFYIAYIMLCRQLNREARKIDPNDYYISSLWGCWFIPVMGLLWSFLDYLSVCDMSMPKSKFLRKFKNRDIK